MEKNNILFFIVMGATIINYAYPKLPTDYRYPQHSMYSMYPNPWRFIEQIFIIEPELELQKTFTKTVKTIAATLGTIPGGIWFTKEAWSHIKEFFGNLAGSKQGTAKIAFNKNLVIHTIGSLALTIIVSYFFYIITHNHFEKQIYFKTFKDFIITWPNNKKQTPAILQEMFEFVNKEYIACASEEYLSKASPEVVSRVQQTIYEYYSEKYSHKLLQGKLFPLWLKWTLIALGSAIIIKLATSATKDFLNIVDQTSTIQQTGTNKTEQYIMQTNIDKKENQNHLQNNRKYFIRKDTFDLSDDLSDYSDQEIDDENTYQPYKRNNKEKTENNSSIKLNTTISKDKKNSSDLDTVMMHNNIRLN